MFPGGREREARPGTAYIAVRETRMRYSDYNRDGVGVIGSDLTCLTICGLMRLARPGFPPVGYRRRQANLAHELEAQYENGVTDAEARIFDPEHRGDPASKTYQTGGRLSARPKALARPRLRESSWSGR